MGKLFKRLLFGAAVGWLAKTMQEKRDQWSQRPVEDLRSKVRANLPAALDESTKSKIVDGVVTAVKGKNVGWVAQTPAAQELSSPPPPHTPSELRNETDRTDA